MRLILVAAVEGVVRRRGRPVSVLVGEALDAGADGVEVGGDGAVLAEVFGRSGPGFVVSASVADEMAAAAAIEVARGDDRTSDLWLRAGDLELLGRLAEGSGGALHLVHSRTARLDGSAYEREAANLARAGVSAVSLPWDTWSLGLTTLYERFGLRCQASAVRETRHLDRLLAAGVEVASVGDFDRLHALAEHRVALGSKGS